MAGLWPSDTVRSVLYIGPLSITSSPRHDKANEVVVRRRGQTLLPKAPNQTAQRPAPHRGELADKDPKHSYAGREVALQALSIGSFNDGR